MTVELRPLGVKCNIQCEYCYQNSQRNAGAINHHYDLALMKAAILQEGGPFFLFGGEPLLMPLPDLEDLWSWGLQEFGCNFLQTNGTLLTDAHIALFKKYRVAVGLSLDGPGELNDVRWHGTLENTRRSTAKAQAALEKLCRADLDPGLIITLHRCNARRDRLPQLLDWVVDLDKLGIRSARLHLLETDDAHVRETYRLTAEENIAALLAFADLQPTLNVLAFDVFADMLLLLRGTDQGVGCVWSACDPYTTAAVRGVEGQGQRSNCGRTNKDGIDYLKASSEGFERYLALYQTPQENGGCQHCRFFLACKGQCPGTALDGDWRNRTEDCAVWMALFNALEQEMIAAGELPISRHTQRADIERVFIEAWSAGRNLRIADALRAVSARGDREATSLSF